MFTAEQYRAKAAECVDLIKRSEDPGEIRELRDSKRSFSSLADNEDWLASNIGKTMRAPVDGGQAPADNYYGLTVQTLAKPHADAAALAADEERILRYLGAAVIMRWSTIPTKLERELFDTAGAMGELLETVALRGQIAKFLHKHKNDEARASR